MYNIDNNKLKAGLLRKYLLSRFGNKVNVYIYFNGRSCLRMMNGSVDLVIYDSQNERGWNAKQGIDILKIIKTRFPKTTVVMHTSNDDVATAIEAMRLGATDYVVKDKWSLMKIVELVEKTITQPIKKLVADRPLHARFEPEGRRISGYTGGHSVVGRQRRSRRSGCVRIGVDTAGLEGICGGCHASTTQW